MTQTERLETHPPRSLPPRAPASTTFEYRSLDIPDLSQALSWTPGSVGMSGLDANATIVSVYTTLDSRFDEYLCHPELSTWLTFAKYSARDIGAWIRSLEGIWTALCLLDRGDPGGALRAGRILLSVVREESARVAPLQIARRAARETASDWSLGSARRLADPLALARRLRAMPRRARDRLLVARRALVEGNTELFGRIGFAFDLFMTAEARGGAGLAALEGAIRSGRLDDPSGYLLDGFRHYRVARALAAGPARATFEPLRRHLVYKANLLIAVQEQAFVLQRPTIFGHPVVRSLLGQAGDQLSVEIGERRGGAGERFHLLPDGGNWADFAARMGFKPLDGAAATGDEVFEVELPDAPGAPRRFIPDRSRRGTILDLLTRYLDGPASERLRKGRPRPIDPAHM